MLVFQRQRKSFYGRTIKTLLFIKKSIKSIIFRKF